MLTMFEIRPELNGEGKEVTPDIKFTTGLTRYLFPSYPTEEIVTIHPF